MLTLLSTMWVVLSMLSMLLLSTNAWLVSDTCAAMGIAFAVADVGAARRPDSRKRHFAVSAVCIAVSAVVVAVNHQLFERVLDYW